jgi:branched-chain amino acid transport system permease protein
VGRDDWACPSISSFVAGALRAFVYLGAWEPLAFNIDRSFQLLLMVIIGGLGSLLGSFLGAAFGRSARRN